MSLVINIMCYYVVILKHNVFWPGINKAIEEAVWQCEACTQLQAQNAAAPLTLMPTPSCPWQMCATDIFALEATDYLMCSDFYSKMILSVMSSIWPEQHHQSHLNAQRDVLRSMEFLKYSAPTMALSMWVHSSLSSAPLGVSHTRPEVHTTCNQMDLLRHM